MIKEITFEEILPFWKDKLWPNRCSAIEPVSAIQYDGKIDMSIMERKPTFFGYFIGDKLVGVNSGFKTKDEVISFTDAEHALYRSRGIFVDPLYRGHGIAERLLQAVEDQAKKEGCFILWTMPRQSAFHVYEKFGFERTSEWSDAHEFGPNCFAVKFL